MKKKVCVIKFCDNCTGFVCFIDSNSLKVDLLNLNYFDFSGFILLDNTYLSAGLMVVQYSKGWFPSKESPLIKKAGSPSFAFKCLASVLFIWQIEMVSSCRTR